MSKPIRVERRRGANPSDGTKPGKRRKILLPAGWKRDIWLKDEGLRPAVRAGLSLREAEGGLMVRDPESAKNFLLKGLNAQVLLHSNGRRSAVEITELLKTQCCARGPITEEDVDLSLVKLVELGLLVLRRSRGTA